MAIDSQGSAQQIIVQLETLERILEQEFIALKDQDMDSFDRLQPRKIAVMEMLSAEGLIESVTKPKAEDNPDDKLDESFSSIKLKIDHCHELHRRNEILINRKLEAVKGALASLREGSAVDDIEVYTKSGGLAKSRVGKPIKKT